MSKMTLEQIGAVIEKAWENHDEDGRVILTMKNAQDIMEAIHHLSKTAERIKADEAVCSPMLTECPRCKNNQAAALADPRCMMTHLTAQPTKLEDTTYALRLAKLFHETYEQLAPSFGYETRSDTKVFDTESKNGRLMVAVCEVIAHRVLQGEVLLSAAPPAPEKD